MAAKEREVKALSGCLLVSEISFPQEAVIVCGRCPNRSTDVGDLGKQCKQVPRKK